MGENDKADETVERGIESFADKAAEKEIRELTDFENAIDETLATGYLEWDDDFVSNSLSDCFLGLKEQLKRKEQEKNDCR